MSEHSSNCGCGACAKSGNFTYIRWATDDQGSNFSSLRTADAINRCWMSIVTSPILLDETSISFPTLFFGKWFNVCESECECGGEWGEFTAPVSEIPSNTWEYVGSFAPNLSYDDTVLNGVTVRQSGSARFSNGDKIGNIALGAPGGGLLAGGQQYVLQFEIRRNDFWGASFPFDPYLQISFGDGEFATKFNINSETKPNPYHFLFTAIGGAIFDADKLVLNFKNNGSSSIWTAGDPRVELVNLRVGTSGLYRPYED